MTPIFTFVFLIIVLASNNLSAAEFIGMPQDPAGQGAGLGGWQPLRYASSLKCLISAFAGQTAYGDNSIRCLDPIKATTDPGNAWKYLVPSSFPNNIPSRDNHVILYVPAVDELWIVGGSHVDTLPADQQFYAGRFSLATCHPIPAGTGGCATLIARSLDFDSAFNGVVRCTNGCFGSAAFTDPGQAWNEQLDMGVLIGGTWNSPRSEFHFIVRNLSGNLCDGVQSGPQRYVMCKMPENPRQANGAGASICGGSQN